MKRLIHTVIAVTLMTIGIVSCGSSENNSPTTDSTNTNGPRVDSTGRSLDSPRNNLDSANRTN